jgi:predicted TIM-barrel fold metal-dependent hydrolase
VVIDIHVHLRLAGCRSDPREVARGIALARRAGVDRAVYLFNLADSGGYDPTPDDVRRCNDLGMRLAREHPDFFLGFCYLNPAHDPAWLMEEIERCVVAGPLCGIKLWVAVRATDRRLDPILERAERLGAPVLHHAPSTSRRRPTSPTWPAATRARRSSWPTSAAAAGAASRTSSPIPTC